MFSKDLNREMMCVYDEKRNCQVLGKHEIKPRCRYGVKRMEFERGDKVTYILYFM